MLVFEPSQTGRAGYSTKLILASVSFEPREILSKQFGR